MDGFDQFLIRGVKIIFWKGPSLVMEERQLLGEVMLKYPLLFSLLPESSRENAMEFLKKKMLELGVQKMEELNCFRVMEGHLYWQMTQPTTMTDFELALEEFLFRERLESAVLCLADKTDENCESPYQDIADGMQSEELSSVNVETEHFQNGNTLMETKYPYRGIPQEDTLSKSVRHNHCKAERLKNDKGFSMGHCFGLDVNGSTGKGFRNFKGKRFDHSCNFQHGHQAIKFPPVEGNSRFNEIGENMRYDANNEAMFFVNNHIDQSHRASSYCNGHQLFYGQNDPICHNEKQNGTNIFIF